MKRNFFRNYLLAFILGAGCLLTAADAKARIMMAKPDLYAYETPKKIMTGAVFGAYQTNISTVDVKLTGVKSPVCETAEIHSMVDDNGIMRMRKIDALSLDNAGKIVLEPTGYHIMLINLSAPLKEGDVIPLTFIFSDETERTVQVPVRKRGQVKTHD